jgi:RNA polymerase sigma-70 factor (ECF subfamily)
VTDAHAALAALGVAVAPDALAAELARRGPLSAARTFDVALAWACTQGDAAAIGHLERTAIASAGHALAKLRLAGTIAEDVLAWLRFELLVRPGGALLASYAGRGELASWVRAIAVHEAIKRARRARREVTPEHLDDLPMPEPELVALRGAYGSELTRALADSFRALTVDDRNLLRQFFLDGLTIDMLGKLYAVHRATAARRVAAARTRLVDLVRDRLRRELALSEAGVDQVITLSNLEQSLGQLLRQTA